MATDADTSVWVERKIAILGKPGSGKSAFIKALKEVPLETRDGGPVYRKTIGFEVHPIMVQYVQEGDMKVRISKTVWEFGHFVNWHYVEEMDGIILIGKNP
jgi:broad-specificity NMP kinase